MISPVMRFFYRGEVLFRRFIYLHMMIFSYEIGQQESEVS